MTAEASWWGINAVVAAEQIFFSDTCGDHEPLRQSFCDLRLNWREFVFGFARIDAAAKQAVAHSVEEIN